jgi:hypothetical protein
MIGQILSNNNERYYSNFSPAFREANTRVVCVRTAVRRAHERELDWNCYAHTQMETSRSEVSTRTAAFNNSSFSVFVSKETFNNKVNLILAHINYEKYIK